MTYRVKLPAGADPAAVLPKLRLLEEEEPQLKLLWENGQIHVQIMGRVQLEIFQALVKQRFSLDVELDDRRIFYKETIENTVEGVGHFEPLRHYAEVHLLLEPLPRGSGLVFGTVCPTDVLDGNYQKLILTHLAEKTHRGVLTGAPITDVKITLLIGKAHLKHTEGGDFRQATYRAVRQGLMQAKSVLLEPWYDFRLELPAEQDPLEAHDLIDNIERDFLKNDRLLVTIHYDPIVTSDAAVGVLRARLTEKLRQLDPALSLHDLRIVPGRTHTNVLFDLVLPAGYAGDKVELLTQLEQFIKEQDAAYSCIIKVEQSYTAAHK